MFVLYVDSVESLRNTMLPLIHVGTEADIKCSAERLSIIVVPPAFPLVVALRMAPPFFTSFQFLPEHDYDLEYRSRFIVDLFLGNLFAVHGTGVSLTISLRERLGLAPLQFQDLSTGYLQYSALVLSRPINIDINIIEFGVFVAIPSAAFIDFVNQYFIFSDEIVFVAVTESQVKLSVVSGEVVLTTENKECVIGGLYEGSEFEFQITLNPKVFFLHVAYMCKWVWLFKSITARNLMSINMGLHASFMVCF